MTTEQQDPETALPKRRSIAAGLPGRPRPSLSTILEQYGLVIFLVVLIAFFAVWPKTSGTFLTSANIRTTLENQAVVTIAALGALIPFIAGQFDLTAGANGIVATFIVAALTTKAGSQRESAASSRYSPEPSSEPPAGSSWRTSAPARS